jgi:hypothetical protein
VDIIDKDILAGTAIAQLAEIFRSEWLMVVFYGDESGSHGKGDYVISGYIAHKDTWTEFAKMWNAACHSATPRRIEYLKMSQWQHRDPLKHSGQFLGWSDDDAEEKIHRVLSVLGAYLDAGTLENSPVQFHGISTTGVLMEPVSKYSAALTTST